MKKSLILAVAFTIGFNIIAMPAYAATPSKANIMAVATKPLQGVDVTLVGAKGNDKVDDTAAIQNALNTNDKVFIPAGTYMINVDKSLVLKSNQTLTMDPLAVLKALPTKNTNSSVLNITGVSDVAVSGGQIVGERYSHLGTTGEWGMGISIESANNIKISDVTVSNCWGDGFYVGGVTAASNVRLDRVISTNNRRQGLSITNASYVAVSNSTFKNTNGTAPSAGIDIEPDPGQTAQYITIANTESYGNAGTGLQLMGENGQVLKVAVTGSTFRNNLGIGITIVSASDLTFSSTKVTNNYYGIEIPRDTANVKFTGMTVSNNLRRGVSIVTSTQKKGISNILFSNSVFSNNSQKVPDGADGVRIDKLDLSGEISNITFNACKFTDTQTKKTQSYGLSVGYTAKISKIIVKQNNKFSGNVSGGLLGSSTAIVRA